MTAPRVDVIGIFNSDFDQVFRSARPIRAAVNETSKLMEHPVEDGSVITDHQIINPIEIKLSVIFEAENYKNEYGLIKQAFLAAELFTVRTRTGTYANMILQSIPHEEDASIYDTIAMAIAMKEVQLVAAQFATLPPAAVANPADSDTVDKGEQNGQQQSAASELVDNISSYFSS